MKIKVLLWVALACLVATAAVAAKLVFDVKDIPPCSHVLNKGKPHVWMTNVSRSSWEPIDSKTPMEDCKRRDVLKHCFHCRSTFLVQVEMEGPRCPSTPPEDCR